MRTMSAGLVVLGITFLVLAPLVQAQETTATTGAASIALAVGYIDFGVASDPNDDCAYVKMTNPSTATIASGDIRIVKSNTAGSICSDSAHAPGTIVGSADPAEVCSTSCSNYKLLTMYLKYEDQNGNGNFDANDTLYLDTASTGPLSATNAGNNVYAIRLSAGGGQPAGSLVFANHADYYGGGTAAKALTSFSVTWLERNGNTAFDATDFAYLLPQNGPGFAASSTIPLASLRLSANNPNGAFGTTVKSLGSAGAPAAPTVTITTGTPTVGDYTMTVTVTDFVVDPVSSTPVNAAGHGHIHYFLNGAPCQATCAGGASYATDSKSFTFRGLAEGDKVSVELVNNDHSSLNPVVKQEKTVPTTVVTSSAPTGTTTAGTGTGSTTARITSRIRSTTTDSSIPALGLGPVLVAALVAAVFLTRRKL